MHLALNANARPPTIRVGSMAYETSHLLDNGDAKLYTQIYSSWAKDRRRCLSIFIYGFRKDFRIPMDWIEQSGFKNWKFVIQLVELFVKEPGTLCKPDTASGTPVATTEAVEAGEYVFIPDNAPFTWRHGPFGARLHGVAPDPDEISNASIASSRSGSKQSEMRHLLALRDMGCLVTGEKFELEAAHLVPAARQDIYEEVLGRDFNFSPFETSYGVLLSKKSHALYDKRLLAFYTQDDDPNYYVHVFREREASHLHGHVIERNHFSWRATDDELPDKRLCKWHYQQCILQNLRGFGSNERLSE